MKNMNIKGKYLVCLLLSTIFMLMPAFMMSFSTFIADNYNDYTIYFIFTYILLGVASGVFFGVYTEHIIRTKFFLLFSNGLNNIKENEIIDSIQIVSRDITTAFERISWYAHDISWITSLLICSFISLLIGFGITGLLICMFFSLSIYLIYLKSINEVVKTRLDSVSGFNSLMKSGMTSYSICSSYSTSLNGEWLKKIKYKSAYNGLSHFYTTRLNMIVSKSMASIYCTTISELVIISLMFFSIFLDIKKEILIFAVTSMLLIRSDISNIFLAVIGIKSQFESAKRIERFSKDSDSVNMVLIDREIKIESFINKNSIMEHYLSLGCFYSLVGKSGSGKTQYVKSISDISPVTLKRNSKKFTNKIKTYYINKKSISFFCKESLSDSVLDWVFNLPNQPTIISFDEAFLGYEVHYVNDFIEKLNEFLSQSLFVVFFIDHRVATNNILHLDDIIE